MNDYIAFGPKTGNEVTAEQTLAAKVGNINNR